jgi:hypothetical protein
VQGGQNGQCDHVGNLPPPHRPSLRQQAHINGLDKSTIFSTTPGMRRSSHKAHFAAADPLAGAKPAMRGEIKDSVSFIK